MWSLTWGKDKRAERITKAHRKAKKPLPKTFQECPTVEPYDKLYWDCFNDLAGTRPVGQFLGFIPWTAINDWAHRYGIDDPDEFRSLQFVIHELDLAWIEHFKSQPQTQAKPAGPFQPKVG